MVLSREKTVGSTSGLPTALWVTPVAGAGGVARHVRDAIRQGIPGWRIVVACPEGPLARIARAEGAAVITAPISPEDGARTAIAALRRIIRSLAPDLVHTHLAFADISAALAVRGLRSGRGRRIRLVSSEHGIGGVSGMYQRGALGARAKRGVHRARLYGTDRVIAVSSSTAEQIALQWGAGAPVTVIPNGTDPQAQLKRAEPRPGLRVLSLARLSPEKGIDHAIRAFAKVRESHREATLTVAGTGPSHRELLALATSLGLGDAISFPGHLDSEQALRTHDVIVQLSVWENLSYTLLDAVDHGLGAVATDVGGNAEILPRRCLVDARDTDAVASAIVRQGLEMSLRPGAADAEQSLGERITVAQMCERIGCVYAEVMA